MLKGGGVTQSFEVVKTRELKILAILKAGCKSFHPLKGREGGAKSVTVLRGSGARQGAVLDLRISHFVHPPLSVFNDQSLTWTPLMTVGPLSYLFQECFLWPSGAMITENTPTDHYGVIL